MFASLHMKKAEIVKNKENLILKEVINRSYQKDYLLNYILELAANRANYFQNLTIIDCTIVDVGFHYQDRF